MNKSEEQKSEIKNIKALYDSSKKLIKFFNDYSKFVSEVSYKTKYGEGLKILTPKRILLRLPIALTQVKAGSTPKKSY